MPRVDAYAQEVHERSRIIVPHRGLRAAKTRLAGVLDDAARTDLAQQLLERVLAAVREATDGCGVVISPDASLRTVVEAAGATLSVQRGMGLNSGLAQARDEAIADGVTLLGVLHGDLPDLTAADIHALLTAVPSVGGVAIAPDAAGSGTNAIGLRPPGALPFRFGRDSFAAHRREAARLGAQIVVVERPGLAFDLDTPDDLASWLRRSPAA